MQQTEFQGLFTPNYIHPSSFLFAIVSPVFDTSMLFGANDKDQQDGAKWTWVWQDPAWVFLFLFATQSGQWISVLVTFDEFSVLSLVCIIQQCQDVFSFMSTLLRDEHIIFIDSLSDISVIKWIWLISLNKSNYKATKGYIIFVINYLSIQINGKATKGYIILKIFIYLSISIVRPLKFT